MRARLADPQGAENFGCDIANTLDLASAIHSELHDLIEHHRGRAGGADV